MSMQRRAAAGAVTAIIGTPSHGWLAHGTLATVADLNEQCLDLLCRQAAAPGVAAPLLAGLGECWTALRDPAVRTRAAACPFLLVDAGFADAWAWAGAAGHSVHDGERRRARFFTVPGAERLLQQALVFAWHLVRSEPHAVRLLLGMSAECAAVLAGSTLRQVADLAECHLEWLQPRWAARAAAWEALLGAAIRDDAVALEAARMRGLQLLAADAAGTAVA